MLTFQDRINKALLDVLLTLLRGAQSNDPHAKQAALANSEKILKGLKP